MPLSKYFGGRGEKVMREMKARYGEERGERIFYATARKRGHEPGSTKKVRPGIHTALRRKRGS
jgi:hypothetical protein